MLLIFYQKVKNIIMKTILFFLRKKACLSQKDLGKLARVGQDSISLIEQGKRIASFKTKRKITKALSNALNKDLTESDIFLS